MLTPNEGDILPRKRSLNGGPVDNGRHRSGLCLLDFGTLLIQVFGVDLDNMPVGIADVDLRESGGRMGLQDHAVRIVNTGILTVAFRAEEIYCRVVIRYAHRKVNVTCVEWLLTKSGTVVNDQV
jgi:hypothetical protein